MNKLFKKMSAKKFKYLFNNFTNLETFFENVVFKKLKPNALKIGKNNQSDKQTLSFQYSNFKIYELLPLENNLFLFNTIKSDDFHLKDCHTNMFNVKIVHKFSIFTFSEAILVEKINPQIPAIITVDCSDDIELFIIP